MIATFPPSTDTMVVQGLYTSIAKSDYQANSAKRRSPEDQDADAIVYGQRYHSIVPRAEGLFNNRGSSMPGQTSSQSMLAPFPSLMSVVGDGADVRSPEAVAKPLPANVFPGDLKSHSQNSSISSQLYRRDSTSTFESVESSPTTTVSTLDSALTEPSPSSSPESPTSMLPPSSMKSLSTSSLSTQGTMRPQELTSSSFSTLPGLSRADSPNKKMRNMKNLSVNTSASTRPIPQLPKLSLHTTTTNGVNHAFSAPPTPSFIPPPKAPRKRLSNLGLTITTPESDATAQQAGDFQRAVPSTPSEPQTRTFRFLQSASTRPMVSSPLGAPEGGMSLPPFGNGHVAARGKARPPLNLSHHLSYETQSSPIRVQTLEHVQEETDYELPLSREAKSPAYPQGPICVYDPNVYLYLEPSDTEASKFDVILNVAREVRNPFLAADEKAGLLKQDMTVQASFDHSNGLATGRDSVSEPQTAVSEKSFDSAFESSMGDGAKSVPTTPKATSTRPEYIHIPWDHNTNVVDDLLRLCELIDQRAQSGKRVLVHCQCGVSRSASLVVAYGLYKNPNISVQEAYNAVKDRSRWIGPNMNLIYQLSEFKSKLPKTLSKSSTLDSSAWHPWRTPTLGRSTPSSVLPPDPTSSRNPGAPRDSTTVRKDQELTPIRANSFSPPGSAQATETKASDPVSPGPSSAPPDMQWSPTKMSTSPQEEIQPDRNEPRHTTVDLSKESLSSTFQSTDAPASSEIAYMQEQNAIADTPLPPTDQAPEAISPPSLTIEDSHRVESAPKSLQQLPSLRGGFNTISMRRLNKPLPFRQDPSQPLGLQLARVELDREIVDDVPKSPSLLSPRAAEFTASPFHRTVAGDLAGSSVFEQSMGPRPQADDPRSPVQKGEAPITRNIFDVL
ncbi:MAG: hypothetical protein LQ342_001207 [Letrouitia transgressa]|nr:MAG: hypothetical protein LQ342_001207 [Letrouitia transgressa]